MMFTNVLESPIKVFAVWNLKQYNSSDSTVFNDPDRRFSVGNWVNQWFKQSAFMQYCISVMNVYFSFTYKFIYKSYKNKNTQKSIQIIGGN